MPLVPLRLLLDHAAENNYGVAAFNVNNMEQIQAIMEAAQETDSPVIVQASRGARSYSQDNYLRHLMLAAAELYPQIPIVMHQDHGNSPDTCKSAIENGFTSVMMDGSLKDDGKTPADFDYNVKVTREVVEDGPCAGRLGRRRARLPRLARKRRRRAGRRPRRRRRAVARSTAHRSGRSRAISSPRRASTRWPSPSAPATAPTSSPRKPTGEVLAMDRIEEIHSRLPNCHLVMHGSSAACRKSCRTIINKYGGKLKQTWGVPVEEIQRGIKHGVRKINVDTDNRLAITGAIRKVFAETPEKFDPRDYLKPARDAMKKVCIDRMIAFGQAGQAPKIKPVSIEKFASYYK